MGFKAAPLSGGFMLVGIFAVLFSLMFLRNYSANWSLIIGVLGFSMFIASLISMLKAPVEDELAIDEHTSERNDRVSFISAKEAKQRQKKRKKKRK